MIHNYLEGLNDSQREAVEIYDGPMLVIAGAGSGKTRVLTLRIAHLMRNGKHPGSILSLTFTNKAAREMKERVAKIVGESAARYLWMGTFHSIFARILRIESEYIGFPSTFTIYDSQDSVSLVKKIIKDLKLNDKQYKASDVFHRISKAKNDLVTHHAYENSPYAGMDRDTLRPHIGKIYKIYTERCRKSGVMDFDDLLLQTNILFDKQPKILEKYQQRFQYLLVDEYQDTNVAQYRILKMLAAGSRNICAVGDDSQSIYSFRGARIENILNFQKDYPENRMIKLEQNYRSTVNIVEAANSVIAKNERRIPKEVFTENEDGAKIKVVESYSDTEEGIAIVKQIAYSLQAQQTQFKDHAILYRTNAQSRIFEEVLRRNHIPYKIYGGLSFYQRKEIKDILSYFRLTINSRDDEALKRIINYPKRGIGQTSIDKIETTATSAGASMWDVINNLSSYNTGITGGTLTKIREFCAQISAWAQKVASAEAYDIGREIVAGTGIMKEFMATKTAEDLSRHQNVQELLNGLKDYTSNQIEAGDPCTLDKYMEEIALMTNDDNEKGEDRNKVVLMTIHSSKGLEFKSVYVVGLEEGLFPSQMASTSQREVEEERRLFYVAITRAEKQLFLSYAKSRTKWGDFTYCAPSRFISEIDERFLIPTATISERFDRGSEQYIENNEPWKRKATPTTSRNAPATKATPPRTRPVQNSIYKTTAPADSDFKADHPNKIKTGLNIEHQKFGRGKVLSIEGQMPNAKATIFFENVGQKQLLLKFAKLKIVE